MGRFFVGKDVQLSMTIEVEADSYEEAENIVEDAWANNETFVNNYCKYAASFDHGTYAGSPADYGMALDELCD